MPVPLLYTSGVPDSSARPPYRKEPPAHSRNLLRILPFCLYTVPAQHQLPPVTPQVGPQRMLALPAFRSNATDGSIRIGIESHRHFVPAVQGIPLTDTGTFLGGKLGKVFY